MDQNFILVELLVMGIRIWSFQFVLSKYIEYMKYYMMPLEQFGHIAAKFQATGTWLGENQIHVCSVTWLDYYFPFT